MAKVCEACGQAQAISHTRQPCEAGLPRSVQYRDVAPGLNFYQPSETCANAQEGRLWQEEQDGAGRSRQFWAQYVSAPYPRQSEYFGAHGRGPQTRATRTGLEPKLGEALKTQDFDLDC
jgi:hypothetical protein